MTIATTAAILIGLVGMLALVGASIGRRTWGDPRCRACATDLRGFAIRPAECPGCAVALARPRAIRFRERRRRGLPFVWPLLMFAGAFLAWYALPGTAKMQRVTAATVNARRVDPTVPNDQLAALAGQPLRDREMWAEAETRFHAGRLTADELTEILIAAKGSSNISHGWRIAHEGLATDRLSVEAFSAMCEGVYGEEPTIAFRNRGFGRGRSSSRSFGVRVSSARRHWGNPIHAGILGVELDGERVWGGGERSARRLEFVDFQSDAYDGRHELAVDVEWGVYLDERHDMEKPLFWSKRERVIVPVEIE